MYATKCASCDGAYGEGLKGPDGKYLFPPLAGKDAFNVGAGTARTCTAAASVKHNMPLGQRGLHRPHENFFGTGNDLFELIFNFSTANPGQIAVNATSTYTIVGAGLVAANFDTSSHGIFSAVHVQGYSNSSGVFVGTKGDTGLPPAEIPEPSSIALLGLGLLGVAAARRKFAVKKAA